MTSWPWLGLCDSFRPSGDAKLMPNESQRITNAIFPAMGSAAQKKKANVHMAEKSWRMEIGEQLLNLRVITFWNTCALVVSYTSSIIFGSCKGSICCTYTSGEKNITQRFGITWPMANRASPSTPWLLPCNSTAGYERYHIEYGSFPIQMRMD